MQIALGKVVECCNAQAAPNGKSIERTGIGIVAFARLHRRLVQIDDNGKAGHEEQEEHHPELSDATLAFERLPKQSDDAEQQRQAIEHVVSLVVFQLIGHFALVAQPQVVDEGNARNPVAMLQFAVALNVVLSAREVPHEIAPIHEIALVSEEETQVL